ncbi:5'/3'-nucleotidase SurE [Nannocystis radixulma]|uniref:5'-nucleotidase SurE n=1 Tax=Nannocystis radixulma TaxID=2995305 RepID=A0ABT5B0K6_9BACT|nr:5'/3'-nucleotidase SurE [Nannocystis radixulma]MCY1053918.1 5'/3'-nucleotidase SurE [Nannocystis sp. SCPEA4]MDC0667210.1 5'/3'-nucleotidase SurE [Nannocystis radixulma]
MSSSRPLILVTNDDGILAPGILALAEAVAPLGDVVVCAPETERSGSSHAITLHSHLRVDEVRPGWHRVNGTPVDCVYLASLHLCERRPALVVSGVNPGYNLGSDVFYSGTVGGAAEGFIRGASAMAVSVHARESPRVAIPVVRTLARQLLAQPSLSLLNVNIPWISHSAPPPEGPPEVLAEGLPIVITRLGARPYVEQVERRQDPRGMAYFWIGGPPRDAGEHEGEDTWAVKRGFVSVTPLVLDITAPDLSPWQAMFSGATVQVDPRGDE